MDLGECTKIHDLALRADYEIASKERDLFFELDVSTETFQLLLWKLPLEVIWLNSRAQWKFQLAMLFDVLADKMWRPLHRVSSIAALKWKVIMSLATPLVQLMRKAPLAFLASHTCCSVPGHCNLVACPRRRFNIKSLLLCGFAFPDLVFCNVTDQAEEQFCLPFSCYSNAFVFAPVAHTLEVPVQSSLCVSILLCVKELCQVPSRWQTSGQGSNVTFSTKCNIFFSQGICSWSCLCIIQGLLLAVSGTKGTLFTVLCLNMQAMDHLESFIAECDRRTELAKKRLAETQEEISAEVSAKVFSLQWMFIVDVCARALELCCLWHHWYSGNGLHKSFVVPSHPAQILLWLFLWQTYWRRGL